MAHPPQSLAQRGVASVPPNRPQTVPKPPSPAAAAAAKCSHKNVPPSPPTPNNPPTSPNPHCSPIRPAKQPPSQPSEKRLQQRAHLVPHERRPHGQALQPLRLMDPGGRQLSHYRVLHRIRQFSVRRIEAICEDLIKHSYILHIQSTITHISFVKIDGLTIPIYAIRMQCTVGTVLSSAGGVGSFQDIRKSH